VAAASGVRIDLDPDLLTPGDDLARAAALLGTPDAAKAWVLTGGEDHAMLATFPPRAALPPSYRVIGRVTEIPDGGDAEVLVGGRPWSGDAGWTHFRRA
jgi:thiamine-monophosphate kinase